jgi:hypothetical protein
MSTMLGLVGGDTAFATGVLADASAGISNSSASRG